MFCVSNHWCSEGFIPTKAEVDLVIAAEGSVVTGQDPAAVADRALFLELAYQHTLHKVRLMCHRGDWLQRFSIDPVQRFMCSYASGCFAIPMRPNRSLLSLGSR